MFCGNRPALRHLFARFFPDRRAMKTPSVLAFLALILGSTLPALAQEHPPQAEAASEQRQQRAGVLSLLPADAVTEHTLDARSGKIAYTATAGTLPIFDQSGERKASIFYTAYVVRDADKASRPVTFVFNGGPGAASIYLHLGVVGPKVLDFGPSGRDG
ncbi:MAG: hypothetical protein ACJ8EA_19395, partial [Xanthobacteraceae bacterium]